MGTPYPASRKLELHNTWLVSYSIASHPRHANPRKADVTKHYVDWAANQGFGVIDVNVPKVVPDPDVRNYLPTAPTLITFNVTPQSTGDSSDDDQAAPGSAANELATYLWENYIE